MPDEVQPVDPKAAGLLGTKANTALQYGQFGILFTALTVGGPWVYSKIESFHTSAVEKSAGEHKAAREAFAKDLTTILQDAKSERKEARETQEKSSERVWGRVGKMTEALDGVTKSNVALNVKQEALLVELREERHRFDRPAPAKSATPKGGP